jgi:hypothetical protein
MKSNRNPCQHWPPPWFRESTTTITQRSPPIRRNTLLRHIDLAWPRSRNWLVEGMMEDIPDHLLAARPDCIPLYIQCVVVDPHCLLRTILLPCDHVGAHESTSWEYGPCNGGGKVATVVMRHVPLLVQDKALRGARVSCYGDCLWVVSFCVHSLQPLRCLRAGSIARAIPLNDQNNFFTRFLNKDDSRTPIVPSQWCIYM